MKWLLLLAALFVSCAIAYGHRLDEYLQAARIRLETDQIEVNLDLTPGVAIAPELLGSIDSQRHEIIPRRQAKAYARRLLKDLLLEIDGKSKPLKISEISFPPRADMEAGEGTIQIKAAAELSRLAPGPHELFFRNHHLPGLSVYLANVLIPENHCLQVNRQERDERQQEFRVFFTVPPTSPSEH